MNNRLNKYKYPGAKRLMLEAQELKDKTEDYCAQPIDDNLFEWHFTVRGPPDTAFEGGFYHGRLSFPTEYPMKPPSIILLTPNGRFTTNKKICLSISGYHPETWQPSWSVRTALLALIAFMPTKSNRAIGSLDFSDAERRKLAGKSRSWRCENCGLIRDLLKQPEVPSEQVQDLPEGSSVDMSQDNEEHQRASSSQKTTVHDQGERDKLEDSHHPSSRNKLLDKIKCSSSDRVVSEPSTHPTAQSNQTEDHTEIRPPKLEGLIENSGESSTSSTPTPIDGPSQSDVLSLNSTGQDNRRNYPTLVYASILFILFLLVLRRIVMLVQS